MPDVPVWSRGTRSWRAGLIVYGIALTVATHWPRLVVATGIPASDKFVHVIAFAVLTALLWASGWVTRWWSLAAIALVWAVADEVTQGLPMLHRTVSVYDVLANCTGVLATVVVLGIWTGRNGSKRSSSSANGRPPHTRT